MNSDKLAQMNECTRIGLKFYVEDAQAGRKS